MTAWEQVVARGYEGLVAKDPASPYVGERTLKWLKVKQARYREGERGFQEGHQTPRASKGTRRSGERV
jgi:ATP-dependent DNA ligase